VREHDSAVVDFGTLSQGFSQPIDVAQLRHFERALHRVYRGPLPRCACGSAGSLLMARSAAPKIPSARFIRTDEKRKMARPCGRKAVGLRRETVHSKRRPSVEKITQSCSHDHMCNRGALSS